MAERMGAHWLAQIDAQEAAGTLSTAEAAAKRTRAHALIAAGKDVVNSRAENVMLGVGSALVVVAGLFILWPKGGGGSIIGALLGLFLVVCGFLGFRRLT